MKKNILIPALVLAALTGFSHAVTIVSFNADLTTFPGSGVTSISGTITYDETQVAPAGPSELFPPDLSVTFTALGQVFTIADDVSFGTAFSPVLFIDGQLESFEFYVAETQTALDNLAVSHGNSPGDFVLDNVGSINQAGTGALRAFATASEGDFTVVPEPSPTFLALGSLLLAFRRRR